MRKSFTRFLSVLMLFCAFGLQAAFAQSFDGVNSKPKDNDTNVKPGDIATQFVLAFSNTPAITAAGGTLVIYKDGSILKLVPINQSSSDVSVVGKTLVVKHGIASFIEGSSYELVLATGITVGGTPVAIPATAENFKIGDFTPPVLASTNPLAPTNGQLGVKANLTYPGGPTLPFQISLTFNEHIAIGTGVVAVYNANGTVMDIIRVADAGAPVVIDNTDAVKGKATISVDNSSYFAPETNYYVLVDAGAFVDVSPSANKYAGITTKTGWIFSTRVNNSPAITATTSDYTANSAKLNASINQAGKIWYKIQLATDPNPAATDYTGFVDGGTVTAGQQKVYNLTGLAGGSTEYEVFVVSENTESPANKSAADGKRLTFKTLDDVGPIALNRGLITTDKKTSGAYILFNEQVKGGTGNLSVRKQSDNTLMFTVPAAGLTSTKITSGPDINKWKMVFDFGGTLPSLEDYYIVFPVGYITDMANPANLYGDDAPGLIVPVNYTDWLITSSDFEAPVVTFTTPSALDGVITINFSEAVALADGSGWPWSGDFASWSKYVALQKGGITVPATYTFAPNAITITPDDDLMSNTEYTVILRPGVVKDASVNANVLAAAQTKVFTMGDLDPVTATFGPAGTLNDYTPLTIKFNKVVRAIKTSGTPLYEALTNTNVKATVKLEKTLNAVTTEVDPLDYSASYDAATKTITVVPVNGKPFMTASETDVVTYTLSIRADKIEDGAGTDVEDVVPATATNKVYVVNDYKKPVATLMANEVLVGATYLTITFDEVVYPVTVAGVSAYPVMKMVDAEGNNIAFTLSNVGNEYRLTPTDPTALAKDKVIYYGIGASMEDLAGNDNLPKYKSIKIVGAVVPPTITAVSYNVNGGAEMPITTVATGVAVNTGGKIIVKVTFDVNIDDENLALPVVTAPALQPGGDVTILDTDVSGKVLTITMSPTVAEIPANQQPATHTITIPVNLVEANEAYTNTPVPTFADLGAPVVITVKTKDTLKPVVTATWDGTTGVAMNATLKLTFTEPVTPVAGKTIVFKYGTTTAETVSITSANVVKDNVVTNGTVWVVNHVPFTQYSTLYSVIVAKDAFVDVASNNLGASDVTFTLTTTTNPAPTIATYSPKDEADVVPTSLSLTMEFSEDVEQASITGSRKLVYVIEKVGATADATINGSGDLVIAGDDVQKYYAYVDDLNKVVVSGKTVTVKDVVLDAGKEYYVLITPGAFKDKSQPTTASYAGIASYGAITADPWNFFTKDIYAPDVTLSFNILGTDGYPAANSDIILSFSKLIVNNTGGTTITDSSLPNLVKLEKYNTLTSMWDNLEFTGHITGENTIVIDNTSLVLLEEMKNGTNYRVSFGGTTFKGKVSGTVLGAYSKEFWTTDATAPTAPVVAFKNADEVNDVSYNPTDGDVVLLNIAAADVNSGLTGHIALKVYYLKDASNLTLQPAEVKGLAQVTKSLTGNGNFDVTYKGGMTSKTTYYVYAVTEDVAGNLSAVTKFAFTTDDRVKPELAAALPTVFTNDGKVTLKFNEAVKPVGGAYARVIDNATGITYTAPMANLTGGNPASLNEISIVLGSFAQMSNDVASYTIEVDPGMIVDVPRQVASVDVNAVNSWNGQVGTAFVVTSKDQVKPTLVSGTPAGLVDVNQAFTLTFSEPVVLNTTFTQFVVLDASSNPYDIINTADISGLGTSSVVLSPKRTLVSDMSYSIAIDATMFKDLSGNVANAGTTTISYTAKDVKPLPVTFRCPQDGNPFYLPVSTPLDEVPSNVCIVFAEWDGISGPEDWLDPHASNYESFYINPNDGYVNSFDLKSHVYLNVDGSPVPFTISYSSDRINIYASGAGGFSQYKGKTITYGFTNLYDVNDVVNPGAEVTFSIKPDAIVKRSVMFIPGDNDDSATTKVNITVDQTFKVQFDGLLYTYDVSYPLNNLLMTTTYLTANNVFTMTGVANLDIVSLEEVDGKHVVTLKPRVALTSETTYTLNINSSWAGGNKGIQIGQGNAAIPAYAETFITADVKAPKLYVTGGTNAGSYKPVKVGIAGKDDMLALIFDEKVKGVGVVRIHRWDGVEMASVNIAGVMSAETSGGSGQWKLNIAKSSDLMALNPAFLADYNSTASLKDYYIEVPSNAIQDMAATPNFFGGITVVNEWKISLRDSNIPQVTFVDDTKSGMPVNTQIKLTFDRPVEMGMGWLALYYEDGKAVDLIRTTAGATSMTSYDFTLTRNLAANTKYLVELGVGTFELAADNSIKQVQKSIGTWYFSTEVNAAPMATAFSPDKTTPIVTGVPLSSGLTITFDMDVVPGTGNIQLHKVQDVGGPIITPFDVTDATKVIFDHTANTVTIPGSVLNLQNNSDYYVIIPATAIKNTTTTAEYYAGITVPFAWEFKTFSDVTAPTAVYAPNGPTAIGLKPAEVVLTMDFSENVVAGTGNLIIYNATTNAAVKTISITSSQVVIKDTLVTIKPTGSALPEKTSFYVKVDAGAIKDKTAGNNFAGVADATTWTFATGDFTAPTLNAGYTPTGKIADNHPTFKMTFNEAVKAGVGSLKIYESATKTLAMEIPITDAMASGSVITVTYVYDAAKGGLNKNTLYYVLVDKGAVTDLAGNEYKGFFDITDWTFRTSDFATDADLKDASQFKVYPNPFVDFVIVESSSKLSKIVVTNIAGQVVKEVVNPTSRIQLNELRSGIYFMSLYNTDNVIEKTAKISKR